MRARLRFVDIGWMRSSVACIVGRAGDGVDAIHTWRRSTAPRPSTFIDRASAVLTVAVSPALGRDALWTCERPSCVAPGTSSTGGAERGFDRAVTSAAAGISGSKHRQWAVRRAERRHMCRSQSGRRLGVSAAVTRRVERSCRAPVKEARMSRSQTTLRRVGGAMRGSVGIR